MSTVVFATLGCRLNQIESASSAAFFTEAGFHAEERTVNAMSQADESVILCVVNTCAVTLKAEQKGRRLIRLLLEKYPACCVLVTGCYAELSKNEIEKMDFRIAVLGGKHKSRLKDVAVLLEKFRFSFNALRFVAALKADICKTLTVVKSENPFIFSPSAFISHTRSSVKIQDGCNSSCSYCTISRARGKSVSLDADEVVRRVQSLEEVGYGESVFTAVNLEQYKGKYEEGYVKITSLTKLCLKSTQKIAFRFSSLYPETVDEEFAECISHSRVRPYFHLSLQSGSDKVLSDMGRTYRVRDVVRACSLLRQAKGNPYISADIIVGFPSESEEDFEKTLSLCKECNFSFVHVFPFSSRPGTLAAKMKSASSSLEKKNRAAILTNWAKESKKSYALSFVGKKVKAILEPQVNGVYRAVSENFLHCTILGESSSSKTKVGEEIEILITGLREDKAQKKAGYGVEARFL